MKNKESKKGLDSYDFYTMSKKKKKAGLIEAAVENAIDKVADTAVDKLKDKIG